MGMTGYKGEMNGEVSGILSSQLDESSTRATVSHISGGINQIVIAFMLIIFDIKT